MSLEGQIDLQSAALVSWFIRVMDKYAGKVLHLTLFRVGQGLVETDIMVLADASLLKQRGDMAYLAEAQVRADWLFELYSLARGHEARQRQLGGTFSYLMEHVSPDGEQARVVCNVIRDGKTNRDAHAEFLGVLRHRDPFHCAQFGLALSFFIRWEELGFPEPDFSWAATMDWVEQASGFDEQRREEYLNQLVQRSIESGVDHWGETDDSGGVGASEEDDVQEQRRRKKRNKRCTEGRGKKEVQEDVCELPSFRKWENWGVSVHPKKKGDSHELSYARVKYRLKRHPMLVCRPKPQNH